MAFEQIFAVMKELAEDGNQFFADAVNEYLFSNPEEQESMRAWLVNSFADHDSSVWSVKDALLAMMFPAD